MKNQDIATCWRARMSAKGNNMYSDGKAVFSYGPHFPIAARVNHDTVLFNTDTYSTSTSKHQGYVKNACPSKVITCNASEIIEYLETGHAIVMQRRQPEDYSFDEALNIMRAVCKKRGVKRFPIKKFRENIELKIFTRAL